MDILKTLLLIVSFLSFTLSQAQHSLNGHWWYCMNGDYYEVLINDSFFQAMNVYDFALYPWQVEVLSDKEMRISESMNLVLLDAGRAHLSGKDRSDTLQRLPANVLTFEDYECEMGISRVAFNNSLHHQLQVRAIFKNCKSEPKLPERIKEPPAVPLELDVDFSSDSPSLLNVRHFFETDEQAALSGALEELSKPVLTYNTDSTEALIHLEKTAFCNDFFTVNPLLFDDGLLRVHLNSFPSHCPDKCRFNFYLLIEGESRLVIDQIEILE